MRAAKRIHFMGIGGVGMAGVAFLSKKAGADVSGCDGKAPQRTAWLAANGIPVTIGHSPEHLSGVDELVVTPAVPADAAELVAARAAGIPVRRRGEVLAEMVNASDGVAVCGTHGKTTTATFTAKLLKALGEDPSWCIGGETGDWPVAGTGRGPFVVEADESDGTLALYSAKTLVVTCVDFDHPEHFKTAADYRKCYSDAEARAARVIRSWELDASDFPEIAQLVVGRHNVMNARAAVEVALLRGHSRESIRAALPFALERLPDRRFQCVAPGVYADYAHHLAEIGCALDMARSLGPKRLRVLFQPHRHTRTKALLRDFVSALSGVDELVLLPVYAAFEKPLPGGDIADLYKVFRDAGERPLLARSADEAWTHVHLSRRTGDLVLLVGAGDIIDLAKRAAEDAGRDPADFRRRRVWIGAGTNTLKSDLDDGVEYVRTQGPANAAGSTLGIPWMAGIPGTIGGWVKMNAGAFGHSISEVVSRVKVDGAWRSREECAFAYRSSAIDGEIQDVEFDEEALRAARESGSCADFLARRPKFPPGTKGSVFKNPPGDHAGRLLEEAGAKSLSVGGARVWERHANVIVLESGAPASDFLALARLMMLAVFFKTGIRLEPEVRGLDFKE